MRWPFRRTGRRLARTAIALSAAERGGPDGRRAVWFLEPRRSPTQRGRGDWGARGTPGKRSCDVRRVSHVARRSVGGSPRSGGYGREPAIGMLSARLLGKLEWSARGGTMLRRDFLSSRGRLRLGSAASCAGSAGRGAPASRSGRSCSRRWSSGTPGPRLSASQSRTPRGAAQAVLLAGANEDPPNPGIPLARTRSGAVPDRDVGAGDGRQPRRHHRGHCRDPGSAGRGGAGRAAADLFNVDTREGPKTGWFFVDRESLAFFGSVG